MPTLTVCPKLLKHCFDNSDYLFNILYTFAQDNGYKIAFDDKDNIRMLYQEIGNQYGELFKSWIDHLTRTEKNYQRVSYNVNHKNTDELFLNVCCKTFDKILVAVDKIDYVEFREEILEEKVCLLDKDETLDKLRKGEIILNQNIINGDGSNIIIGNNNTTG